MAKVFDNILETIGHTPIVRLHRCVPQKPHTFYGKVEYFNPGGSIKDRIAMTIIEQAEKKGELKSGGTIIEATSGNTGLGLAMVAAIKGYKAVFVMPDKISEEKRAALRAFSAKVIITPTAVEPEDPRSYYSVAKKLVEATPKSFYANQYHNPDNVTCHYLSTGPELWDQMDGKIDVLVGGVGTGGTMSGIAKFLKEKNPAIKVVCTDPDGSILHDLFYFKEVRNPPHPYKVEGVGEDMLPENVHFQYFDEFIKVEDGPAFLKCREMTATEGLCVGPSAALAVVGAIEYSKRLDRPSNIVIILPDHGKSYLSKVFNDSWMRENGFMIAPLVGQTVGELITSRHKPHRFITVDASDSVAVVVETLKKNDISQVPVLSDGEVLGVLDESDLLVPLLSGNLKPTDPILHLIKGSIVWVRWEDSLQRLAEHLQEGYIAMVKDRSEVIHIVTKIDLLDFVGERL